MSSDSHDFGVALVTGGGNGIGKACARALARAGAGAAVAVVDLDGDAAASVSEAIGQDGVRSIGIGADVADPESVEACVHAVAEALGEPTILVNSAGLIVVEPLLEFSLASWRRVMDVNVTGSFLMGQAVARRMAPRKRGRIINIASVSGFRAGVGRTAYGTSKAAVIGLTRQFALELGPLGVTCNAVAPGVIQTPMTERAYSEETWAQVLSMVPTGRRGQPEDIAEAVRYLASPAASYVNGEVLTVDGGYIASGMTQTGTLSV